VGSEIVLGTPSVLLVLPCSCVSRLPSAACVILNLSLHLPLPCRGSVVPKLELADPFVPLEGVCDRGEKRVVRGAVS